MPAFTDLPYEILSDILSHLPGAELARIAGLSSRLYDVSQPLLYDAPFLPRAPRDLDSRVTWRSRELLLRTLLTPSGATLAVHVRSLRVEWDRVEAGRDTDCLKDSLAVRSASALRLGLTQPLWTQVAQLMLIFDLLPRLQILDITPTYRYPASRRYSYARFLDHAISHGELPLGLHSLHSFHCASYTASWPTGRIDGFTGPTILTLLNLPSIRTIDVPSFSTDDILIHLQHAPAATSHTTRLRFSFVHFSPEALGIILRCPIALTHFSYTAARDIKITRVSFVAALAPLRTSLRSLHVDFRGGRVMSSDYVDQGPPEALSLREWPALRTLSCALVVLLGEEPNVPGLQLVDVLPLGLRELEVLWDRYWRWGKRVEEVEEVMRRKREVVPVLERVAVVRVEIDDGAEELGTACEAVGVELVEAVCRW